MDASTLLETLDPQALMIDAPSLIAWKIGLVDDADGVAQFMVHGGPYAVASAGGGGREDKRPQQSYWQAVKAEMRLFLCTDDARYKQLWERIRDLDKKSTSTIVAIVSAYLGAAMGIAGAAIAGFVALCFYALLKLGKEAYCRLGVGPG